MAHDEAVRVCGSSHRSQPRSRRPHTYPASALKDTEVSSLKDGVTLGTAVSVYKHVFAVRARGCA